MVHNVGIAQSNLSERTCTEVGIDLHSRLDLVSASAHFSSHLPDRILAIDEKSSQGVTQGSADHRCVCLDRHLCSTTGTLAFPLVASHWH